ncbi:hypothetical protein HK405_006322 [Cladochytrium tenue]|nr:hypothetical protein HK405_006322 [Cladochytrium tenue]
MASFLGIVLEETPKHTSVFKDGYELRKYDAQVRAEHTFVPRPDDGSVKDLPVPDDPSVTLRQVPEQLMAVHRFGTPLFGGHEARWTAAKEAEASLRLACARDGVELEQDPRETVVATYNPPWTPWFLRTNEVMVRLAE